MNYDLILDIFESKNEKWFFKKLSYNLTYIQSKDSIVKLIGIYTSSFY